MALATAAPAAPAVPAVPTAIARRPALPALTSLRAFAAIDIVFFHFWNPAWFGPLAPLTATGYIGLNFFFLLSGFILAYNYTDRQAAGQLGPSTFFRSRFARLYPTYLLGLLVSLPILELEWAHRTHANFFLGLSLTAIMQQSWSPKLTMFWNTPAWSLSCEAVFYLLFPLLLGAKWPRKTRRLVVILALLWLASQAAPLLYLWSQPAGSPPITRASSTYWLRAITLTPLPHLPTFAFGIALSRLNDRLEWSSRARFWMALAGGASILAIMMQSKKLPYLMMHNGLLSPLFAIVILGLCGRHLIARIVGLRLFVLLGEASYALYLLHFNLWQWIHAGGVLERLHLARFDPWISYFLLEVAAILAYRYVERPARKWLLRVLPGGKTTTRRVEPYGLPAGVPASPK